MSLFRKFFYRKPPDGLLEISERVYVFDSCYTTGMLEDDAYRLYIGGIVSQLRDDFPDASFMVFNFRDGEYRSQIAGILCEYDMTVMDYPRQYEGCPLLTLEMIHHFLRSSESWLSLGQQNVILVHCEQGGWPILAFMLAALLIYRKQFTGEQKTLDMIYKQAPYELLQLMSPVNPLPSQIRYLQYVSRRNVGSQWPPLDRALTLDCIILRFIPNIDGEGGCRPIFRIFGQDPLMVPDKSAKVLFATPKRSKLVRYYKQADCELVKIDIHCHVQGDVVLECISLDGDLEREAMVFRVMFNTAFIRSNILMLNHDEIDILWNAKDQFPKDFRVEALFSEMDAANSVIPIDLPTIEDKEGLPVEAFSKVQEIFSAVDWSDPKTDVALNVLQHLSAANLLQENTSSPKLAVLLDSAFKDETKLKFYEDYIMSPTSPLGKQSIASIKNEPQDMQTALPQPLQSAPSPNPSIDSNTTKNSSENLEVQYSLREPSSMLPKDEISVRENSPICMLSKDVISVREYSEPKELQVASPKSEQSLLFSEPSADKNSNRQKTGAKDRKVAFHGPTLDMLSCKPSRDEPKEHQVSLQLPAHSKILSPRLPMSPISTRISQCTSLQGSSVPLSRYHSAPSALGITALLHDHAESTEQTIDSVTLPSSSSATSSALIDTPKNLQLSYVSTPLPVPPPPPAQSSSETSLSKKALVLPPPPPPSPPIVVASKEIDAKHPCPRPPPSYLGRSHSVMSSNSTPPPPPPLPPCFGTSPSSTITKLFPSSSPLPPPPPPSGISPSVRNSSLAPPPPPLPPLAIAYSNSSQQQTGVSVPPPPPPPLLPGSKHVSSSPPPPPPPGFASRGSSANNSTCAPSAPPPPAPSAKGISTDATASLHPHSAVNNGNVPAIPGLPSAPLNSKGRGLSRPGARSQAQTKKANLKPYHWLKLTRAMQGSLWAEAQKPDEASKAPEIDLLELESLFSAAVPDKTTGGKSSRIASGPKLEKVQLIELRRAYNCEIMLSKVKIPLPELMSSVLTLDDSTLDVDQVENLIKFCPTKEEMELLKGYNGDKDNLGKCEQFFLELMKAPRIESKLRVFSFKIQFHSQVSGLRKNLNIVNSAAEEVKKSVKLKRIMQTILTIGNALNHGTARGSAIGFRLDSLLKLTDTRAQNNKMTLMHYLCKVVADKLPESLDFPKDLVSLEAATKIQLKYLAEEMQAISKGLEKVVQELTASENDGPVSEIFCKTLKEFLSFDEGEVRSLASLYSSVGRNADALALYFGEDPARCPFEQVVSTMLNFVRMFGRAHEENCKHIELEKKKALKEAENEKPTVSTPRRGAQHMLQSTINSGNIR